VKTTLATVAATICQMASYLSAMKENMALWASTSNHFLKNSESNLNPQRSIGGTETPYPVFFHANSSQSQNNQTVILEELMLVNDQD
jgi:hypothetical protein